MFYKLPMRENIHWRMENQIVLDINSGRQKAKGAVPPTFWNNMVPKLGLYNQLSYQLNMKV